MRLSAVQSHVTVDLTITSPTLLGVSGLPIFRNSNPSGSKASTKNTTNAKYLARDLTSRSSASGRAKSLPNDFDNQWATHAEIHPPTKISLYRDKRHRPTFNTQFLPPKQSSTQIGTGCESEISPDRVSGPYSAMPKIKSKSGSKDVFKASIWNHGLIIRRFCALQILFETA